MTRIRPPKPKPTPYATVREAFSAALGIASAPWEEVVDGAIAALDRASYLRRRTAEGRAEARATAQAALAKANLIPIGGDIDGTQGPEVARVILAALAAAGQLSERALRSIGSSNDE